MRNRRRPGISKIFGERCNSHASATCMGVAPEARSNIRQRRGLQRCKAPEREERHVSNAIVGQSINHCIISTVRDVVFVLHTDNFGNLARLCNLRRCDVAQANMFLPSLVVASLPARSGWPQSILPLGHDHPHHNAQVNHIQYVKAEIT